jgi:hypothetical protein
LNNSENPTKETLPGFEMWAAETKQLMATMRLMSAKEKRARASFAESKLQKENLQDKSP